MKCILVILDGLAYSVAHDCMGYLQALCHKQKGKLYLVKSELPSLSRPLYECILTGISPIDSGINSNAVNRLSKEKSVFHYAQEAKLKTAAAAYHWVSELYNSTPFDPVSDRHTINKALPIQNGHFYYEDHYPDSHLLVDGEHLRIHYQPDFLLIHSMNIDDAGHKFGLNSPQYRTSARQVDNYLSYYLENWLSDGYQVMVTSDHGMTNDCHHGGISPEERNVPLFVFGNLFSLAEAKPKQTEICGTICSLLDIKHNKSICYDLIK